MTPEDDMNDEIAKMQLQLERLSDELRNAKTAIQRLESKTAWRRPHVAILVVLAATVALFVNPWNTKASNGTAHTQLAADEKTTIIKAPLEVDDDNGNPIMIVRDQANGNDPRYPRGLYITDQSKKAVVKLGATDDDGGGGEIMVTETGPGITSTGAHVNGIEIIGTKEKSTIQVIRAEKKIVSMGGEQDDKGGDESGGSVQVFGSGEKTFASLSAAKTGGELKIFDTKSKQTAKLSSDSSGGSLKIYGAGDKPKATISADTEGGLISVFGTGEKAVATLKSDGGNGKLSIANKGGNSVIEAVGEETGGSVKVMKSGDDKSYTSINSLERGIGLMVRKGGTAYVFAGANENGGTVDINNSAGDMVDTVSTMSGKGLVAVFSGKHPIAFLTESDKHPGGGNVTVTDPGGSGIFSAGFTGEGGDACVNRKSGLKCLGVALPLQIN